ncbi:MAG: hypothetical protein AAGC64_00370 [Bacteroidota bacterium]
MELFKILRKQLFWTNDFFNGSQIAKHYKEIKFVLENHRTEKSQQIRSKHLKEVLSHASENVPFYKKNVKGSDFSDFPIINKATVLENYNDFESDVYKNKKNTQVSTNGSTGTPFKLFHDKNKRSRHQADNLYFAEKGGYELGDRLYLLRALHKNDSKALLRFFKQNFKAYGILNYNDKDIQELLNEFKSAPPGKCVVCFASMCEILVNYLDKNDVQPFEHNVKSIVTDGDALSKGTKDKMEKYFGIPVYARYGNMECGVMAQQGPPNGYHYNLNWASYHFEILDLNEDTPAKPGEMGRIVVTDLFNHCMPLVRYDTGDLARFALDVEENTAPVFDRIDGRVIDIIWDTSGNIISPYLIYTITEKYNELKQFQFAQKAPKRYVYRLNPWKDGFMRENELMEESKTYLGQDAEITIEYVDEVPLLASKKRKPVINEM